MTPTFDLLLKTIKEGLKQPRDVLNRRHMQGSTGAGRRQQNLLAKTNRADATYPNKLKDLKRRDCGVYLLNDTEVRQIKTIYKITDLEERQSRNLGNTGITFYIADNKYYIKK